MTLIMVSPIKKGNYYTYNKLYIKLITNINAKSNTVRIRKQTLKPNKL